MSPVRALLVARAQSVVNRLRREAGGTGLAGAAVFAVALLGAVAGPGVGSFALGRSAGARFGSGQGESAAGDLATFLGLLPLFCGVLGGLLGGEAGLGHSSLRLYPISRRQLFAAELLASAAEVMPILAGACLLSLVGGMAVARPALAFPLLLLALEAGLWTLLIDRVLAGLRGLVLRRLRWVLGVSVVVALWLLLAAEGSRPALVLRVARAVAAAVPWLPAAAGCRGLEDFEAGRWLVGLARQLVPLAAAGLLVLASYALYRHLPERGDTGPPAARAPRLWSFRHPSGGIARLFIGQVVGSRAGLIQLAMPAFLVMSILLIGSDLAALPDRMPQPMLDWFLGALRLPWGGLLPPLAMVLSSELWINQFGWDGPGIKTLLLMPIAPRDLLLGKLLGLAGLLAVQLGLAVLPLAAVRPPRVVDLVWGLGAGGFALLTLGGLGHVLSAGLPRDLAGRALGPAPGFASMLASAVANALVVALLLLGFRVGRGAGPWGLALAMWALCGLAALVYWRVLPLLGERVMALREQLIDELG